MHAGRRSVLLTGSQLVLALLALAGFSLLHASSIVSVGVDEMLRSSDLVFEGKVVGIETRPGMSDEWQIHTYVTFEVINFIKGHRKDDHITLRFLGGTANNKTLKVSDMVIPAKGEQGIYFIEKPSRDQVHPLYGWSQGHLIIEKDRAGVRRVLTNRKTPVFGVKSQAEKIPMRLTDGVARDLRLRKEANVAPVSVEEFRSTLKRMLEKQE